MAKAKVVTTQKIVLALELTEKEANILRAWVQNPLSEERQESELESNLRKTIFEALNPANSFGP